MYALKSVLSILGTGLAMVLVAGAAYGGTIHVDCTNTTGPWDGSAGHPYQAIQDGIDAAIDNDEVIVRACTYTGPRNRELDFAGKDITVRSTDPSDPAVVAATVVDCEGTGRGFYFHSLENAASVLDGLTIINGAATFGGGILCYAHSRPTIKNCTVIGCDAQYYGGGICCYDSCSPIIINCAILGNSSALDGGGIYTYDDSHPAITNCVVGNNRAQRNGGGVYVFFGIVPVINCTIVANQAGSFGGGCLCNYGDLWMDNCILWSDVAPIGPSLAIVSQSQLGIAYSDLEGGCNAIYQEMSSISCGPGIIDQAPLFVQDPDWGADGIPATGDDDFGDLHLAFGSPCSDAGDNTAVPADAADLDADSNTAERTPLDIDLKPRFIADPTNPDSGVADPPDYPEVVDLGAYEFVEDHSVVRLELGLGGENHGAAGDAFFTPGDPADEQQFVAGSTITWDTAVTASGIQSAGYGAGYPIKGVANLVFDLALYKDAVAPGNLVPEVTYFSTANGGSEIASETREDGIQKIVVDFDGDVSCCYTPGQVVVNGGAYTPAGEALVNNGTRLEIYFAEGQLPDQAYYNIDIGASVSCLDGDTDCLVRSLVGDTNTDSRTDLTDMALAKFVNGSDPRLPGNARLDVNLDGRIDLTDMALIKSLNGRRTGLARAAFAYRFDVAGQGPGRMIDPFTHGGPRLAYHTYPTDLGDGRLLGMGAGYPFWSRSSPATFTTAGVGQIGTPPVGDPVYGGLGTGPVCEGQLDTAALGPGTYILKVIPSAYGINVLRGDVPLGGGAGPFATAAEATIGDEIRFVLVNADPQCHIVRWASERFHPGRVNDWLPIELGAGPTASAQGGPTAGMKAAAQADFGRLQACVGGPGVAVDAACADTDLDADGDVDANDASAFMRQYRH